MNITLATFLLAQPDKGQQEYFMAYALIIALVVLGTLVICVPRTREKHFVEPTEEDGQSKSKAKKKRR